ncbi:hypothetical protein QR680_013049 [Steinernema hermaphroditum]|uniref:Cyclic nucleotide-binding domain-containing protein n=1 Tax=Steinernema hermaphroditum TaxID=289476 RepID=A0AA39I474_9BILA|nr:hypothetical protein QR680_013049 [Steinernema hermaphroditum]
MDYSSNSTESTLLHDNAGALNSAIFFFSVFALIAGTILNETNRRIRFLRIPDSVLLFLCAIVGSLVIKWCLTSKNAELVQKKFTWEHLSPHTVLFVLLPPMTFESAFKINAHLFWSKFGLILSVTVFLYFSTLIAASAYLLPLFCVLEEWWLSLPFLLCSILVATDPVAVVALLDEIGAPKRMKILIEGESLLNDGLAIFVFNLCGDLLMWESGSSGMDWLKICRNFGSCVLLSPLIGWIAARFILWILTNNERQPRQVFLLIALYLVFFIGEETKGSAALAVMFFGLTMSYYKENLQPSTIEKIHHDWENYGYWANCIIFMIGGYIVGAQIFHGIDFFWMLAGAFLSVAPLVARIFSVFVFFQMWQIAFPQTKLYVSDFVVLSYGGLRGALALLLAMELNELEVSTVLGKALIDKLVIFCCASVFSCLVIQGMTFVFLAMKEGTSKRSKYLKTTEKRLRLYLRKAVGNGIRTMRRNAGVYLREANWNVVKEQIQSDIFPAIEPVSETSASSHEKSRRISTDNEALLTVSGRFSSRITKSDVRSGYYGILLGRVHDEWVRGAISGPTAHVLIAILEHGIDEGRITSNDFRDQLKVVEASRFTYFLQKILGALVTKILTKKVFVHLSTVGAEPFAVSVESKLETKLQAKRDVEWWWLLSMLLSITQLVMTASALYSPFSASYVVFNFCFAFVLFLEHLIQLHRVWLDRNSESALVRMPSLIPKLARSTVELALCAAMMVLAVAEFILILILVGRFADDGHMCLHSDEKWRRSVPCDVARAIMMSLTALVTTYKLLRGIPLAMLCLHEVVAYWIIRQDRIRLSVLHFFQHLTGDTKIYRDLFTDDTYKVAITEQRSLNKIVEGMIRYEMKRNPHMMDVIAVIKTRQAIRMASHTLHRTLKDLRKEGFLPDENFSNWSASVHQLRKKAERVVSVSRVHIAEQLQNVRWIQMLEELERKKVIKFLSEHVETEKCHNVPEAFLVHTRGTSMYFVLKGVCKLTERTQTRGGQQYHEMYVYQGDFIGEFNIVTIEGTWKALRKKLPKRVKIQYRTVTECELIRIDISLLLRLRRCHQVVETILHIEQLRRLKNELKELKSSTAMRMMTDDEFDVFFANNGRRIRSQLTMSISDNKLMILGCAVRIVDIAPETQLNDRGHAEGPATLTIAPIDNSLEALILLIDWSGIEFPTSDGGKSNISIEITDHVKKPR